MVPSTPPDALSIPPRIVEGDFAGWLRDAMAERGMTTRGLAMRTGIHHSIISRLMRGDRDPSLSTMVALLRVLGRQPLGLVSSRAKAEAVTE
jgi:transcriptional regulator with XRE-family HTH domain